MYNTDKKSVEEKFEDGKKTPDVNKLITNSTLNSKIKKVERKFPDVSKLVTNML